MQDHHPDSGKEERIMLARSSGATWENCHLFLKHEHDLFVCVIVILIRIGRLKKELWYW